MIIASSRKERVAEALSTLPKGAEGHVADLADESAIKLLLERLGPIDHLVFTAADPLQLGPLTATDIAAARTFFTLRY